MESSASQEKLSGVEIMKKEQKIKRLIIKIGTSTITDGNGALDKKFIDHIVDQVNSLRNEGVQVCIVTSGAVACGKMLFKSYKGEAPLTSQVLATRGQPLLMDTWSKSFERYDIHTFQFLLTQSNLEHPSLPLRQCMEIGVPVINYNDGVSTEELKAVKRDADNDDIAACAARLIDADLTIFLTQSDGVMDHANKTIATVHVSKAHDTIVNKGISNGGTGGIINKVKFAKEIAKRRGSVFIVDGRKTDVLLRVTAGEHVGTKVVGDPFLPAGRPPLRSG